MFLERSGCFKAVHQTRNMHRIRNSSSVIEEDSIKRLEYDCDSSQFLTHGLDRYFWRSFSGEEKEDFLNDTPRISNYNHGLYLNLERKIVCNPYRCTVPTETSSPKTAIELVKEITTLEIEIIQLEHKLLSLYRTTSGCYTIESTDMSNDYSRQSSDGMLARKKINQMGNYEKCGFNYDPSHKEVDCSLKCSVGDNIVSHVPGHNAQKDMLEVGSDHIYNTIQFKDTNMGPASKVPCKLSEEIIRCIAAIYCKIAKMPESKRDKVIFPACSLSFSSTISQQRSSENRSPRHRHAASPSSSSSKFGDEIYSDMVEIPMISVDGERFGYASKMLRIFRNLIKQLKSIDPRKMAHQEQIAFWINIHNALVMHAFLAYGLDRCGMRSKSSIFKAAYNIGGHSINAYVIQRSILCCQPHFSASWVELLLSPSLKFMRKQKHLYVVDPPQPLVHFAICQGAYSDPPARVYRPKHILRELKNARKEFIRANVKARNKTKIFLPKILSYYMKDCSFEASKLLEMVYECVPEAGQGAAGESIEKRTDDCIVWLKFDSTFRYIICKDLAGE